MHETDFTCQKSCPCLWSLNFPFVLKCTAARTSGCRHPERCRRALLRVRPSQGVAARSCVVRPSCHGQVCVTERSERGRCAALIGFAAAAVEFTSARSYRALSGLCQNSARITAVSEGGGRKDITRWVWNLGVGEVSVRFCVLVFWRLNSIASLSVLECHKC